MDDYKLLKEKAYDSAIKKGPVVCPICNKIIYKYYLDDCEYIRTKRKTNVFICRNCIGK